jgi:hypothetical protein
MAAQLVASRVALGSAELVMMSLNVFKLCNSSGCMMALGLTLHLTESSTGECFWEVKRGRFLRLTTSPLYLNRLCGQCGILNISQPCRTPWALTGIVNLS